MPLRTSSTPAGPLDLLAMNAMVKVLEGIDRTAAAEARLILAIEAERLGQLQAQSGEEGVPSILGMVPALARGWKRGARRAKQLAEH